jgi:hypothetical protein
VLAVIQSIFLCEGVHAERDEEVDGEVDDEGHDEGVRGHNHLQGTMDLRRLPNRRNPSGVKRSAALVAAWIALQE